MKYLLNLLFFSITFLNAETIFNGQCVDSYYTLNDSTIYYYRSATPTTLRSTSESKAKIDEFRDNTNKFYYDSDSNSCVAVMSDSTTVFMESLSGVLIGFIILFGLVLITIRVGSK